MEEVKRILEFELFSGKNFSLTIFHILKVVLILLIARLLIFGIQVLIRKSWKKRNIFDKGKEYSVVQLCKYFIYTIAIIIAINNLGIDVSILIAGSAALFVGIGLGLQDTFKDLFSGLILLFENTVAVGDVIQVDAFVGVVKEIRLRTSRVMTRDGISMIIPNSKLISGNVVNWSHDNRTTRFHIKVGVAYGSDTEKVRKVLLKVAEEHPDVFKQPEPDVRFTEFGNSSLNFELLFWTDKNWEVESIKSMLRYEIDQAFRENNIKIPFPQRDLHFKSGVVEVKKD